MEESVGISKRILLSVLTGHKNVSAIRINTNIRPETLSNYLKRLAKQGLINVETKGWKKGKPKPCYITNAGITWLVNSARAARVFKEETFTVQNATFASSFFVD